MLQRVMPLPGCMEPREGPGGSSSNVARSAKRTAFEPASPAPLFRARAVPGISASPSEDNLRYFNVIIMGPQQSAYEGGLFKLELFLPEDYPMAPPKVRRCCLPSSVQGPRAGAFGARRWWRGSTFACGLPCMRASGWWPMRRWACACRCSSAGSSCVPAVATALLPPINLFFLCIHGSTPCALRHSSSVFVQVRFLTKIYHPVSGAARCDAAFGVVWDRVVGVSMRQAPTRRAVYITWTMQTCSR